MENAMPDTSGPAGNRPATATPSGASWELFPHGADVGVAGSGTTKAEAFRHSAVDVSCRAPSDELLLVEWLDALIFEMATRSMLFADYSVAIDGGELHATAWGEPVDPGLHAPAVEVKGATLTALRVGEADGVWRAQCVVDV
jgi:SHS2 domain-containing protein